MTRPFTPMAAAILAAFASQGAMAQSAPDTTMKEIVVTGTAEKDYAPGLATVGGKEPAALRDVPQTVNVAWPPPRCATSSAPR